MLNRIMHMLMVPLVSSKSTEPGYYITEKERKFFMDIQ
jgi:hypothetical protein